MKLVILAAIFGTIILIEAGLRLLFGLGKPPLYIRDQEIGYLLAPNQNLRRLGNQIKINQYSMRADSIEPERPDATLRVFLIGDSIANGAWWTDQQETISALMEADLAKKDFPAVEVLNASANSWGPRNQVAYLRKFGTFEAQAIVLLLNTDDLFATAPTSLPVGRDRNYPETGSLALIEVLRRLLPSPSIPELAEVQNEGGDRVGFNLEAIRAIEAIATENNAQLLLAMTPLKRELEPPGSRDYERKARQRLQNFAAEHNLPYIDFLPLFEGVESPESLYRDHIHLSSQGNQLVSETLTHSLIQILPLLQQQNQS